VRRRVAFHHSEPRDRDAVILRGRMAERGLQPRAHIRLTRIDGRGAVAMDREKTSKPLRETPLICFIAISYAFAARITGLRIRV
jgi:hypothetical protein